MQHTRGLYRAWRRAEADHLALAPFARHSEVIDTEAVTLLPAIRAAVGRVNHYRLPTMLLETQKNGNVGDAVQRGAKSWQPREAAGSAAARS